MDVGAVIIPANAGWFIASVDQHRKLIKDPVIAWAVDFDQDEDAYEVDPITFNTSGNSLHFHRMVLIDPNGQIVPANRHCRDKDIVFESEEEAAAWCSAAEDSGVGVVRHRKSRQPPLTVVETNKPPEVPE